MKNSTPRSGLQLRSLVKKNGELELSLADVPVVTPGPNEVLIRIEAAPINPSDLGLLLAGADITKAMQCGTKQQPRIVAPLSEGVLKSLATRVDLSMPVGNEAAGVVIEAGASDAAQALLGKTVAALGGAMYSQYRCVTVDQTLLLPEGATPADGASAFINPLTALCMIETLRNEGHKALVHTAAASNLGQMLQRICTQEGIALVNIVRDPSQVELLRAQGATHVCNSSSPTFMQELIDSLTVTGATLAFDAVGAGTLASQILTAMETVLNKNATEYSRYGSPIHKQVYIYGALGQGPLEINRNIGLAWGVSGWLVTPYLQKIGAAATDRLKRRIAAELKTTFASHYAEEISLAEALDLPTLASYGKRATGQKYLINPCKGFNKAPQAR